VDTETPADPDDGAAASIRIRSSREPGVAAERHGDDVMIVGDPESLAALGENVARLVAEPEALGKHIHVEYFPGHTYIRPNSAPLLVRRHERIA
jgi:hypothetical protein